MQKTSHSFLFLCLLLLLGACHPGSNPFYQDRSSAFKFPSAGPEASINSWSLSNDSLAVAIRFPIKSLALLPDVEGLQPVRRVLIRAVFYPALKQRKKIESPSLVLESGLRDTAEFLNGYLHIPFPQGTFGLLQLELRDLQKQRTRMVYCNLDRREKASWLDWRIKENGNYIDRSWVKQGSKGGVTFVDATQQTFLLRYYSMPSNMPLPPFSKADVVVQMPQLFKQHSITKQQLSEIEWENEGLLRISHPDHPETGRMLSIFSSSFPAFESKEERQRSWMYLMQRDEVAAVSEQGMAFFWAKLGVDKKQSERLEQAWMLRIQQANQLFSTYTPGWKTDRGMIYTIFGPPITVYNNGKAEEWNYPVKSGQQPLSFRFVKAASAFSNEEYLLERKPSYALYWYKAIETWRSGTPFSYE